MMTTTNKAAHDLRDNSGRYVVSHLCDACNKPAGTEPCCDDEVTKGHQIPGFILCDRKACLAKHVNLEIEARRALFVATVAARKPAPAPTGLVHATSPLNAFRVACRKSSMPRMTKDDAKVTCPKCLEALPRLRAVLAAR